MVVQVRKTVSVLFADVVGSTALGERVEPEALRRSLDAYFAAAREVLEHHGGTVEKFIGDAVMAVFGIPELHEDDALRAVRAAAALRDRVAALEVPVPLEVRIGVATGPVVAGEGETFATGDAVNVAARLEAAAAPGEIVVAADTYALSSAAVRAEPLEPLSLKGKGSPVPAYRLLDVLAHVPAFTRRFDAPFVGRERELRLLLAALGDARSERRCRLAVVTGDAGIGKSRLVRELVQQVRSDADVVVGRCLSYGDGITYWPLREIVQQRFGDGPLPALEAAAADALLGAVGSGPASAQTGEINWSVRRLFEALAQQRPLVVVFDDLHWAEPAFLDLVDYLHDFVRDAPILVVATGRPELLDARPLWRASALELTPLAAVDAVRLVEGLASALPETTRARVVEAAEGNPLFVEQLLATAADGDAPLTPPPTVQALLSARIDALPRAEQLVVQCGSVEGRLFHRGAVAELARPEGGGEDVLVPLLSLVRRQLVRPDEPDFPHEDAFRFSHALVRDAAYEAAPKSLRTRLHESYARWLRRAGGDGPFDEILAYHLEQAARFAADVGAPRPELAAEAGALLGAAGRRALGRGDIAAAAGLLERAAALLPPSPDWVAVTTERAFAALQLGRLKEAREAVASVLESPAADEAGRARAGLIGWWIEMLGSQLSADEARAGLEPVVAVLRAAGDDRWTARALIVLANTCAIEARFGPAVGMLQPAFDLPEAMSDPALRGELLFWFGAALMLGPVPVPEARAEIVRLEPLIRTPLDRAWLDFPLAVLEALAGRFDEARRRFDRSRDAMRQIGATVYYAGGSQFAGWLELAAGRPKAAETLLREGWEILGDAGELGLRSSVGLRLASALVALDRDAEAEEIAGEAIALTSDHDASAQFTYRGVLSRIRTRAGAHDDAVRLAREAVVIADRTDCAWHHAEARLFLAEAAAAAGLDEPRRSAAAEVCRLVDAQGFEAYREQAGALAA